MNRQSNTYTIIYSTVLVVLVGVVLSVVYQALRPKQVENIQNDTRRQILAAALITPSEGQDIATLWQEHITASYIVNDKGEKIDASQDPFDVKVDQEVKKAPDQRLLPVFECNTDKGMKYILPVYGAGLWGPIWGYIAFDNNGDTIYGAYFAHQGETPGLGAEIEKPAFQKQFEGKRLMNDDCTEVALSVVKKGKSINGLSLDSRCDAVTGATLTSNGVNDMLHDCLARYTTFLTTNQ